jgi:hypothetical protein
MRTQFSVLYRVRRAVAAVLSAAAAISFGGSVRAQDTPAAPGQAPGMVTSEGFLGRVLPARRSGAWEVFSRYSDTDLNEKNLAGGRFNRATLGLSYYQDTHWRYEFNYGYGRLDRSGQRGIMNIFQARLQYEL